MLLRAASSFFAIFLYAISGAAETGNISTFELGNGLQGVVIEDHRAPVVTNMVWYRVGSADEPAGYTGVAHFLEHLMFKGTNTLKPGDFSKIVKENGGLNNAFTSYDYTGYFQRVAVDRLSLMMQLEADRMRNLVLSTEDVNTERNVVIEERRTRVDSDPNSQFREQRRAMMFINHRNPVSGWQHEIEALNRKNALDFYKTYYAPNNAILVIAGDVYPDEVRALAEKHFGPLEPSNNIPPRVRPKEPPHLAPVTLTFSDSRQTQPYMIRSYHAPKRQSGNQKEAAALMMFAQLLGGSGLSSVMGQKLELEQQIAVATSAWYDSVSFDPETFGLYAMPRPGVEMDDLVAAVDKALDDFLKEGIDLDHLERLKVQVAAEDIYKLDDQSNVARTYGRALTAGLTVEDVKTWSQVLQEVTGDDIMTVARKVLNIKQSVTGLMLVPPVEGSQ